MRTHEAIAPHTPDEAVRQLDRLLEAIDRVKSVHLRMREDLQRLYAETCAVRAEKNQANLNRGMIRLIETVRRFQARLSAHSRWEEKELYPLAVWYFGNDMDVFTLMEQEHVLAEHYLEAFLQQVEEPERKIDHPEAQRLASYLLQAYALLKNHFQEEEDILAAFADQSNAYGF